MCSVCFRTWVSIFYLFFRLCDACVVWYSLSSRLCICFGLGCGVCITFYFFCLLYMLKEMSMCNRHHRSTPPPFFSWRAPLLGESNMYTLPSYTDGYLLQNMVTKLPEASQFMCQTIIAVKVLQRKWVRSNKNIFSITFFFFPKLF